jgi:cell division protein FtsQ
MARNNNGPQVPEDEFASTPRANSARAVEDGTRQFADDFDPPLDLDIEQESPFLRAQKRVPVRRGPLPRKTASRLKRVLVAVVIAGAVTAFGANLYRYGARSWRFRVESSDNLEIAGTSNVFRSQVMEILGGDIGRNIFFVPLAERKKQLEEIPWVESATVMRLLPNRLKVVIRERTPVAFVLIRSRISLIDAHGVVMEMSPAHQKKYSFPVIVGMGEAEPLSTRAARMKLYTQLVNELDSGGGRYSQDLSDVDLSDPEDVKVTAADPNGQVLVHLGSSNFLDRYKIYVNHVQEWRQQFAKLESVDLRYDRQVIVNPDEAEVRTAKPNPANPPKPAAKRPIKVKPGMKAKKNRAPKLTAPKAGVAPFASVAENQRAAPKTQAPKPLVAPPPEKQPPAKTKPPAPG